MNIRPAVAADSASILALDRASPAAAHWSDAEYRRMLTAGSDGPERLVLVAESADAGVVGFLVARYVSGDWELENIVVDASLRRNLFGQRLVEALVAAATERNSDAVFLEVRESNTAARGLYKKLGFREKGRRRAYYHDPSEDAILYRIDLS